MKKNSLAILLVFTIATTTGLVAEAFQSLPDPAPQRLAYQSGPGGDQPDLGRPGRGGHSKGRGGKGKGFAEKLGLSDEQRDQMRDLKVAFRNQTRESRINLMSLKDEKRTMIMSAKIDQKKLKELDEAVVKARTEVQTARLKMRRDRISLLTPDQLKKLADLTEKQSHKRGHRGFRGKGWGRRY